MANTQTSVPAFVASQVLTAQQQTEINTGIPVFATTVTRDAAFGGAGEKALAEGQFAYIEATNTTQYYDGAAWQSVGTSGLTFITGTTFATATSVSFPASTFTSTYQSYKFILSLSALTADADFTLRLRASGTDDTTAQYDNMFMGITNNGSGSNSANAAQTAFTLGESDTVASPRYSLILDIVNPQLALPTSIYGSLNFVDKSLTSAINRTGGSTFRPTTVFDSATFISSVASSMTGNYKVYGYANS
jgi:hypothetical protein